MCRREGREADAGWRAQPRIDRDRHQKSTLTRSDRKAQTRLARSNNELIGAGRGATQRIDAAYRSQRSTKTRAETKAETRLAIKEGALIPAGEGGLPTRK